MKRLTRLSIFTFCVVLLSLCIVLFPTKVNAASESDLEFELDDGGNYRVSHCKSTASGVLEIPATYKRKPVTSIGVGAFSQCADLTEVVIPNSVTSIGDCAFFECTGLTSMSIPKGVISIGSSAFYYCVNMTSVVIPDTVLRIGRHAFIDCPGLTDVYISDPNAWCRIDFGEASIPCGILHIVDDDGTEITDLVLDESVTIIPEYAFAYCHSLISVTIPDNITRIGACAFYGCQNLSSVIIGDGVTHIYNEAFYYCCNLTSVRFGNSITRVGDSAFYNCTSLTNVIMPDSAIAIGNQVFGNCSELVSADIGDNVVSIGDGVFEFCENLKTVNLGNNLSEIGKNMFYSCTSLNALVMPDTITAIGDFAFYGCQFDSICIPKNVESIGESAFEFCDKLAVITFFDDVSNIYVQAFNYCSLDHVFYVGTEEQWKSISIELLNDKLTSAKIHFVESVKMLVWNKNCVNAGMYCVICNDFITRENDEDGSHSYTDSSDISCNDCDFVQSVSSITIYQKPTTLEYGLFDGALKITDGIIQVKYNDGAILKVAMTPDMVSGFDNTRIGTQTLVVTYEGKTTTYNVEIVPGTPLYVTIDTLPTNLNYITGSKIDLSRLTMTAYYANNLTAAIPYEEIDCDPVDMSTMGIKIVKVGFKGVYTTFNIYVHTKETITLDSSLYPESSHNYASNTNESKTYSWLGAGSLTLTFNSSSYTESNYDWVYIYDKSGNQIGKYSGNLAGKVVTVPGDSFTIKLTSDGSVNKYGYAFSSIVAETVLHTYENNACTICGQFENGLVLTQDTEINEVLDSDWYIDLNGYDLSGTIITNGYKIYGMDSTTSRYTCDNMGTFNCVDESGDAIVPESLYTHADTKRYMTVETDGGYTFHRFYLGITNISLATSVTGFGYKAEFYGDEMVQSRIASVGYNLWLSEDHVISKNTNFKNTLTLRLKNFDVANYGNVPVNACVTITLIDGTVITGATHSNTLQQAVETVNTNVAAYTEPQLAAVHTMIEANPAMQAWAVENIFKKES